MAYANEVKVGVLGIKDDLIQNDGVVSEAIAKAMASGVAREMGASVGIGVTGIAGPEGGTEEKPVGTVCIGLATPDKTQGKQFFFPFGKRSMNKSIFAMMALEMLRRELLEIDITI